MTPKAAPATCPGPPWRSRIGGVLAVVIACAGAAGQAEEASPAAPAAKVPTLEGTRDATVPPPQQPSGGGAEAPAVTTATPPEPTGTLSSWRAAKDRSAIRIGSGFGADELLGAAVVDHEGRALGRIEDLLIDTDGMVRKAMLRASEAAPGSPPTVIDLLQLQRRRDRAGFVLESGSSEPTRPE
jgi:sporulation protein YlmC with PRC-barrel domain